MSLIDNCADAYRDRNYELDGEAEAQGPLSKVTSRGMKYDAGKLRYSLVPTIALKGMAQVMTFGANKYAPNSWQTVPNAEERYLDALFRHLEAYRSGITKDPETGISHLSHLLCNAAFLLHFEQTKTKD